MRVRSRTSAVLRFRSAIVMVDLIEFLNSLSCAKFSKKQEEEGGKEEEGALFGNYFYPKALDLGRVVLLDIFAISVVCELESSRPAVFTALPES